VITVAQNVVSRTLTAADNIGSNPIAMVETSNGKKLYVVNQGSDTVTAINTVDKSVNAVIPVGASPIWAVARADDARVYILNQGSHNVSVIDTVNDVVLATVDIGVAANYMAYDDTQNRLYLTIPSTSQLAVLNVASDPPVVLPSVNLSTVCPVGTCQLDSVTTLPQGTNTDSKKGTVYVSSYIVNNATCSQLSGAPQDDPPCITTQVSVISSPSNVLQKTITPLHTVFVNSQSVGTKADVPVVPFCNSARFRRHIAAAKDATRVFVANCDGGGTDIIRTSDDSFVLNLPAPVSSGPALPHQSFPPPQNPVFVLPGR
jgi:YVTN family beta-propeller protein